MLNVPWKNTNCSKIYNWHRLDSQVTCFWIQMFFTACFLYIIRMSYSIPQIILLRLSYAFHINIHCQRLCNISIQQQNLEFYILFGWYGKLSLVLWHFFQILLWKIILDMLNVFLILFIAGLSFCHYVYWIFSFLFFYHLLKSYVYAIEYNLVWRKNKLAVETKKQ